MSWAGLASNQLVTFDNLRDAVNTGVFDSKVAYGSIPSGNKIVTKQEVESYVLVNNAASPWSGYTNLRCPPKSAFEQTNYCALLTITQGDLDNAIGNSLYPDNTVYVRTYGTTTSYTLSNIYQLCTRPSTDYPDTQWIYYYAYDTIQYGTSILSFSPEGISCSSFGCTSSSYSVLYDAFACAGCSGGGSSVTIYVKASPAWVPGTWVSSSPLAQVNVPNGRYVYGGRCYLVQNITSQGYNGFGKFADDTVSQIVSSTNC